MTGRRRRRLRDKVVVVTGGGRGIGAATAEALAHYGATVVCADIDFTAAEATAMALGPAVVPCHVDVADIESFAQLLNRTIERTGRLDALVNNAGIGRAGPFVDEPAAVTRRQVDVNLFGVINGIKLAAPLMRDLGGGHIVNVASTLGKMGLPHMSTYSATKHAIVGLSEAVRGELRDWRIDVSVVLPHGTKTDFSLGFPTTGPPGFAPLEPIDVAAAIVRVLARPSFEVFVPRFHHLVFALRPLLPQALRDRAQATADRRTFGALDATARVDYDRRTFPTLDDKAASGEASTCSTTRSHQAHPREGEDA